MTVESKVSDGISRRYNQVEMTAEKAQRMSQHACAIASRMRDFNESSEMPNAIKLSQDRERLSKRCKEVEKNMKKA